MNDIPWSFPLFLNGVKIQGTVQMRDDKTWLRAYQTPLLI